MQGYYPYYSPHHCVGFLLLGLLPPPTDRPTDLLLAPSSSSLLLSPSSTHTLDTPTLTRARFTLDTHLGASRLVSAGRGSTSGSGRCPSAFRGQHFRLWTVPERVSGPPLLMLPGAALGSLAARFCWQGQHFRLWTVPERVSGPPPPLMLPGAALGSLAARFC